MKRIFRVLSLALALMTAAVLSASAQTAVLFPESISVDVDELTLQVGEEYTYSVTILPEEAAFKTYTVFVSDPSEVTIDIENSTITAAAPGTAYLYFETANHSAHDIVKVTVGDGADSEAKTAWNIADEDLEKVRDEELKAFLVFLNESRAVNTADLASRTYQLLAKVKDGSEDAQSAYAGECGLGDLSVLDTVDMIVINGSVDAVIKYISGNEDLIYVRETEVTFLNDPDESDLEAKALTIEGGFEQITTVSEMYALGYTGKGNTIAVIDSGIASEHPEFKEKTDGSVVNQHCFGTNKDLFVMQQVSVCENHAAESDSAYPSGATNPAAFAEGTMAAGAAAGKGGVAPGADIIAVAIVSETRQDFDQATCEGFGFTYDTTAGVCYSKIIDSADEYKAYEWLLKLESEGRQIDAVALRFGDEAPTADSCDDTAPERTAYLKQFADRGIPVISGTGDNKTIGSCSSPACINSVYSVAASNLNSEMKVEHASISNLTAETDLYAPGAVLFLPSYTADADYTYDITEGTAYAAAETAGAMLLLHEMFPYNTMTEISHIPAAISNIPVNTVGNGLDVIVPELDFSAIKNYAMTAPNASAEAGENTIDVTCEADSNAAGYEVAAYLNGAVVNLGAADMDGTVSLSGLQSSTEYTLKVRKYIVLDDIYFYSSTQELTVTTKEAEKKDDGDEDKDKDTTPNTITFYELDGARRDLPAKLPGTGFSAVKPTALEAKPASVNYSALHMTISIPSENLEAELLSVPYIDGDYPVRWLGSNAGVLEGFEGATFIAGHNHLDDTGYGPFFALSTIAEGTRVFLTAADGSMKTYEVYANASFDADDFAGVVAKAGEYADSLALITCEDETIDGGYAHRRVVFCKSVVNSQ